MRPLLRLELHHLVRQKLTWIVLALLYAAMLAAAATGTARVRAQEATLARVVAGERAALVRAKDTVRAWSRPAGLVVPIFRDPTDAYSYFYNFLTVHAVKPPAPLAAIAAGQSDLQPGHIRIDMNAVFPDTAYELRNPRTLALGAFDLAFVLVYLVPLAIIALAGTTLTREQDSGVLRLIAAQPVAPRRVAGAKFGALALMLVPAVAVGVLIAALAASAAPAMALLALSLVAALYAGFWVALCALVASFWRGSVQTLAILVLAWATMTVLVPAIGALLIGAIHPAPSRLAYIDRSRALADAVPTGWEDAAGTARWLSGRPDLASTPQVAGSAEAGRLARDVFFRRALAPQRTLFDTYARSLDRAGTAFALLSPATMLDIALQRLAGTDIASQRNFVGAADRYGQTLRRWFEPRIVANIGIARACPSCPGRLNFSEYDDVPVFPADDGALPDISSAMPTAAYLFFVAAAIALSARRRFRKWPV